ncbi:hypothetical protein HME7025_01015 [Aquirufa nivalisilvae]|uniref:Outer membrane protein beta-barrel domain-containing protein n=1 Tax=Aquirufa nivalisilvae TaxID=2516557 RepID=A0A2S2DU90_9BACT|nr:hypothetical protein [Aquirufa nivalisilvae]AWL08879.1 hypothetical protein HME7025_01015 [Aquirufa nivalisilvae]
MKQALPKYVLALLLMPSLIWAQRSGSPSTTTSPNQIPSKASNSAKTPNSNAGTSSFVERGTWAIGLTTTTNSGIFGGFNLRKSWNKNPSRQPIIGLDIVNLKDYREFTSPFSYNGRSYIEGKLNNLLIVRPEFGMQWMLFKKSSEGGAALKGILATGPSLGIKIPYYVDVSYLDPNSGRTIIKSIPYTETMANSPTGRSVIVGEGGYFAGSGDSKMVPGWHLKSGFDIELNTIKRNYLSLEVGFIVDVFQNPVEILNQTSPRSVYTTGYLTFFFGRTY